MKENLKVLMINGSPKANGNTAIALREMENEENETGITDDAMVVERMENCAVKLVEGSYENMKITTPEDLVVAESLIKKRNLKKL